MLFIDPESLYNFAHDISTGLHKYSSPVKHKAADYNERDTLDTIPSSDELYIEEIQMTSDTRFKFLKRTLFMTSLHLFLTIGMAYLLSTFQESLPSSMLFSGTESDHGLTYMLYWSMLISFCLCIMPPLGSTPVLNIALLGLATLLTADYIAVRGFVIPLYSNAISMAICLCCPFQIFCLGLYIHLKKSNIGASDFLALTGMSIIASLFAVLMLGDPSDLSQWVCVTVISLVAQSGFLLFTNLVKNQDKAKLSIGDHIQAMMSLYMGIYIILGILTLFTTFA